MFLPPRGQPAFLSTSRKPTLLNPTLSLEHYELNKGMFFSLKHIYLCPFGGEEGKACFLQTLSSCRHNFCLIFLFDY